jgi:RimJ/RimL family protein N-acetyltransferase
VLEPDGHRCEIALSIADAWQGRGLGTVVLRDLEARARRLGARCLVGEILRSNAAMKGLARKAGFAFAGPLRDARLTAIREAAGRRGWCGAGARPDIAPRKRG